jgi:hypothetical protein
VQKGKSMIFQHPGRRQKRHTPWRVAAVTLCTIGLSLPPAVFAVTISSGSAGAETTSESIAFLLVSFPGYTEHTTAADVAKNTIPFLDTWYDHVSYGAFAGFSPATAANVTDSDTVTCDRQKLWQWAVQQYPFGTNFTDYVVVVPNSMCPTTGSTVNCGNICLPYHYLTFLTDDALVAKVNPFKCANACPPGTSEAVYYTAQEIGHTIFGTDHADSLQCGNPLPFTYSASCVASAESPNYPDPYPCFIPPGISGDQICQYGDPWDAMGSNWPGRLFPATFPPFKSPKYEYGDAWPNGVELDHVGWVASRKQNVSAVPGSTSVYTLSPLDERYALNTQVLFIPPTPHLPSWLEIEYRNPPAGTSQWTDGYMRDWPTVTNGVLLHLATGLPYSSSALLDATPGSRPSALCPTGVTNIPGGAVENGAYCDYYDATLTPANPFTVPGGDYTVTLKSVGTVGDPSASAVVEVTRPPCTTLPVSGQWSGTYTSAVVAGGAGTISGSLVFNSDASINGTATLSGLYSGSVNVSGTFTCSGSSLLFDLSGSAGSGTFEGTFGSNGLSATGSYSVGSDNGSWILGVTGG